MNISWNLNINQPYGGWVFQEWDLSAEWLYKTSADVWCHNPDMACLSFLKSSQCFGKPPKDYPLEKALFWSVCMIRLWHFWVTFLWHFVLMGPLRWWTWCALSISCVCMCVGAIAAKYVAMPCSTSAIITLHQGHEVQMIVSVSLKVMLSLLQIYILQYEFKYSSWIVCVCMRVGLWLLVWAGRAVVALTTLAHSPVVPHVTDE